MPARKRKIGKRSANPPRRDLAQKRITQTTRQAEALRLKISGASYEQIAVQMGYRQRDGAWKAVQEALRKTIQEPADEVRKMELARLDRLLLSLWQTATTPGVAGHMEAVGQALKIMTQRTFYITGLKVPEKVAPTTPDGTQPYAGEGLAALLAMAHRSQHGYADQPA